MHSSFGACSNLLALGILSFATVSAELYSLDPPGSCAEIDALKDALRGCVLPCAAESTVEYPINPRVNWLRMISFTNRTYIPLSDPFWYESPEESTIDFGVNTDTHCVLDKDQSSIGSYYYDCSVFIPKCVFDVHLIKGVDYRCRIKSEHSHEGLTPCARTTDLGGGDPPPRCYAPTPSRFAATYSNTTGIDLNWSTVERLPGSTDCSSILISVTVSSYRTYNDYATLRDPEQIFSVPIEVNATEFRLGIDDVRLGNYYVFAVTMQYRAQRRTQTETESSPLFYFGIQERPFITFPVMNTMRLRSIIDGTVRLRCEAQGIPAPRVSVFHRGSAITSESEDPSVVVKTIRVNEDAIGEYICIASGTYVAPDGGAVPETMFKRILVELERVVDPDIFGELVCTPHGSTVCHTYFSSSSVLINTTVVLRDSVEEAVETLATFAVVQSNGSDFELFRQCVDVAMAMVCHSAHPFCSTHNGVLVTRKVCNSTCGMFSAGGVCESVLDRSLFPEIFELMLSNCDTRVNPGGSNPECIHVPLEVQVTPEVSWCSRGDGQSYAGDVIVTTSGTVCQDWVSQRPHAHPSYAPHLLHLAGRDCRNPGGQGERPWCYTSDYRTRWEYCDVPQCTICEPYIGGFCSDFPGYGDHQPIYVDRHESEWDEHGQSIAESWMLRLYHSAVSSKAELPDGCREGLKELICHNTLPLCSQDAAMPTALCPSHCQLMELLQVCPRRVLDEVKLEMQRSGNSFFEPVCGSGGNQAGGELQSVQCLPVQTRLFATVQSIGTVTNESCYNSTDQGLGYQGSVSTTESGTSCQSWDSDLPDARNYCRNPGHVGLRPWCFTDREAGIWDYCDVQECGTVSPGNQHSTTAAGSVGGVETEALSGGISSTAVSLISSFAVFGMMLIIISIILAVVFVRYFIRKRQKENSLVEHSLSKLNKKRDWDYVVNQTYSNVAGGDANISPKLRETIDGFPQYSKASIKYIRQLGQGNFGVVFYAKAEGMSEDEKQTEVAVKTLKEEEHCPEALEDFVREAKLMFSFDHQNIVKILGVCTEEMPFYLIFEYMDKGDLAQFLRSSASSLQRHMMNPLDGRLRSRTESTLSDEPPSLNMDQLVDICQQIANGMKYLAENNHVHRDLACRNCLAKSCDWEQTDSGLIIKIGDFGMSQNLYSSDYYRVRGQAMLPVRWMSPEAVIYGKFSTNSDVWSFGVVMWEIFSFAMQPYYGTSNEEVTEAIRRHKILARPTDCPNRLYELMKSCWTPEPKLRPDFEELYNILSNCRLSLSSSSDGSDGSTSRSYGSDLDAVIDSDVDAADSDAVFEENSLCEEDAVTA